MPRWSLSVHGVLVYSRYLPYFHLHMKGSSYFGVDNLTFMAPTILFSSSIFFSPFTVPYIITFKIIFSLEMDFNQFIFIFRITFSKYLSRSLHLSVFPPILFYPFTFLKVSFCIFPFVSLPTTLNLFMVMIKFKRCV